MVDLARYFLQFTQNESLRQVRPLPRWAPSACSRSSSASRRARARRATSRPLEKLAATIKTTSLCGLGQTAPNPVLTTIRYFREEYEAHIGEKRCPALACKALIVYTIDAEKCTGCRLCAKRCPARRSAARTSSRT